MLSSEIGHIADPAELFCRLYDEFDDIWARNRQIVVWLAEHEDDDFVSETARLVARGTISCDQLIETLPRVATPAVHARFRLRLMRVLDATLAYVGPGSAGIVPPGLAGIAARYARDADLSPRNTPGSLVPRIVRPTLQIQAQETLSDVFTHVLRVPPYFCGQADHRWIPDRPLDLEPRHRVDGLRIAVAPLLGELDELHHRPKKLGGAHTYAISAKNTRALRERIAEVLSVFDDIGCDVALVPELALTPPLLKQWKAVIREKRPDDTSPLRWVVAGTGPLDDESGLPPNRAVVLCRRTAREVWTQDKIKGFTLQPAQLRSWGLEPMFGARQRDEHITLGRPSVMESAAGRFSILICEDIGRTMTVGPIAGQFGVSLVFSPIFSKEILRYRWEQQAADQYDTHFGCRVVVANSLAVANWRRRNGHSEVPSGENPNVALVRAAAQPDEADAEADSLVFADACQPNEVLLFHVSSRGVRLVTRRNAVRNGRFQPRVPRDSGDQFRRRLDR